LIKAPRGLREFLKFEILSFKGTVRLLLEPFIKKNAIADSSVDEFISERFGREFATRIVATALNGIYAANTKTLSIRSALPFLWKLYQENGSVIKGFVFGKSKRRKGKSKIVSFVGGMQSLPQALAKSLGDSLRLNANVIDLLSGDLLLGEPLLGELTPGVGVKLATGEEFYARNLVLACPTESAAGLIQKIDSDLAASIQAIPYAPLGMLYLSGEKGDHQQSLAGVGFLKQPKVGAALLGVLYSTSSFPNQNESNLKKVLLTCFVGGMLNPELSDVSLTTVADSAFKEAKEILGLGASFKILHAYYWPKAIPSYPVGHFELVSKVKELEKRNIYFATNWLERPGLPDCILRGEEIAQKILKIG